MRIEWHQQLIDDDDCWTRMQHCFFHLCLCCLKSFFLLPFLWKWNYNFFSAAFPLRFVDDNSRFSSSLLRFEKRFFFSSCSLTCCLLLVTNSIKAISDKEISFKFTSNFQVIYLKWEWFYWYQAGFQLLSHKNRFSRTTFHFHCKSCFMCYTKIWLAELDFFYFLCSQHQFP